MLNHHLIYIIRELVIIEQEKKKLSTANELYFSSSTKDQSNAWSTNELYFIVSDLSFIVINCVNELVNALELLTIHFWTNTKEKPNNIYWKLKLVLTITLFTVPYILKIFFFLGNVEDVFVTQILSCFINQFHYLTKKNVFSYLCKLNILHAHLRRLTIQALWDLNGEKKMYDINDFFH